MAELTIQQKRELLVERLNAANVLCPSLADSQESLLWVPEDLYINQLVSVPDENFNKLLSVDFNQFTTVQGLHKFWESLGYLYFKPFIRPFTEDQHPILTVCYDVHLQLWKGMYFASLYDSFRLCSDVRYDGFYRSGALMSNFADLCSQSVLANMLFYAACIDVGFRYPRFQRWVAEYENEFNTFMKSSMRMGSYSLQHPWHELKTYIRPVTGWPSSSCHICQILNPEGILAEFTYVPGKLVVRTSKGFTELEIPVYTIGISEHHCNLEQFGKALTITSNPRHPERPHYTAVKLLLVMLLALEGVTFSWRDSYRNQDLAPLAVPGGSVVFRSLRELDDTDPENFTVTPSASFLRAVL